MLVLALDTTTRWGSCAVVRDGQVLREETSDPDRAHASRLPGDLMQLLARTGLYLRDIDMFAVAIGPGSFTGLRIGIAAMQGLAFATGRPLIGVSAMDALAGLAGAGSVTTWVDAWRGEVFASSYEDGVARDGPVVAHPRELLQAIASPTIFIGDGADTYRELITAQLGPLARIYGTPHVPLAARIGTIALGRADQGEHPAPHAIRPIYVRRPGGEPRPTSAGETDYDG